MKKLFKATVAVAVVSGVALLSGCTGQVYNAQKNCSYDYLFHPSVSISKVIGGCGLSINCLSRSKPDGPQISPLVA